MSLSEYHGTDVRLQKFLTAFCNQLMHRHHLSGEAWVLAPEMGILQRVRIDRRTTFDSAATPTVGAAPRRPSTMADIDASAIKAALDDVIERAKADDPKELKRQIADLRRELAEERAKPEPEVQVERVEVPVLDDETRDALRQWTMALCELPDMFVEKLDAVTALGRRVADQMEDAIGRQDVPRARAAGGGARPVANRPGTGRAAQRPDPPARREPRRAPVTRAEAAAGDSSIGKAERAFLTVLAQYPEGRTRDQVAIFAGYSVKSRHIDNTLASLRSAGFITGGRDHIQITDAGLAVLGDWDPLPTGSALVDHFKARFLGKAECVFLDVLLDVYPDTLTRDEVAERAGYSVQSRHVDNTLARLRSLQLIVGGREAISASEMLVDG